LLQLIRYSRPVGQQTSWSVDQMQQTSWSALTAVFVQLASGSDPTFSIFYFYKNN
jgi:hypothetical protein